MKFNIMLIKTVTFLVLFVAGLKAEAQYFYKDIISNRQLKAELDQLKEQKIKNIEVSSFEDDGSPSDGFFGEKTLNRNYTKMETFTRSNITGASLLTSVFDKEGKLLRTTDSSKTSVSNGYYQYDDNGRLTGINTKIRSNDDDFVNQITEEHLYSYDEKGALKNLTVVKNTSDSSQIIFATDEQKNITIEKDLKKGTVYYYYYDTKNRLTDVVHASSNSKRLLPDYIFEYNGAGQITQMTTTEQGSSDYYIWRYMYDNGLRIKEKCFTKERRLMGTIEYVYK